MPSRNVLVFPGGTEVAMEILASLKDVRGIKLYAAGEDVSTHARFAFENYHVLPHVAHPEWLEAIKSLCDELSIDFIFPAHDDAVVALAENQCELPGVLTPSADTCQVCRSKSSTYAALEGFVPVPRVYSVGEQLDHLPLFVKPDRGQGSKDALAVNNYTELLQALERAEDPIVSEFLPGEEFTIDCFSSSSQGLLFSGARQRVRMRNGISMSTRRVDLPESRSIAAIISKRLEMRGAWFFQMKRRANDELVLLEVAPRIAGAMALHRAAGVNFSLLTMLEHEGCPLEILVAKQPLELDRSLRNRWSHELRFQTVYVDLDDTLIIDDRVNLDLVRLLYASVNSGCKIVLLTRHAGDPVKTLKRHRLESLFDDIVHIRDGTMKSKFIVLGEEAIFIDDSFSERLDVAKNCGIPTLDSSMIDFLVDQAESLSTASIARG